MSRNKLSSYMLAVLAALFFLVVSALQTNAESTRRADENVEQLRAKAEQGDAAAQFGLGLAYAEGRDVRQDYKQAAAWWRKAAEQGFALAQYELAGMYFKGSGVKQDYDQYYMWIYLAADQGFEPAIVERDDVQKSLTPWQLEEWQRPAREWLAAHEKGR